MMIDRYQEIRESYQVLGVEIGAPFEEVKKSYLKRIKLCHPDVSQAALEIAEDKTKRINGAIHRIESLSPGEVAEAQRYYSAAGRPRRRGAFPGRRGRDIFSQLRVTPAQAAAGSRWCFQLATCPQCGGWGAAPMDSGFRVCSECRGLGLENRQDGYDLETLCPSCDGKGCTYTRCCGSCGGAGEKIHYRVQCYIPSLSREFFTGVLHGQGHRGFGDGEAGDLYLRVSTGK